MQPTNALSVELYWHPDSTSICKPFAESIYKELNRDPHKSARIGLEIPVYFYTKPQFPENREQAEKVLRLLFVTADIELYDDWIEFKSNLREEDQSSPTSCLFVPVIVEKDLIEGERFAFDFSNNSTNDHNSLIDFTISQCCRLLSDRLNPRSHKEAIVALKLFLSHKKNDGWGEDLAIMIEEVLRKSRNETFFDGYTIQYGDELTPILEQNIKESIFVAIRTDRYSSSVWCRKEIAFAKEKERPIVIVDALKKIDERNSSLLSNLPVVRFNPEIPRGDELSRIARFIKKEVLRFLYGKERLRLLQKNVPLPNTKILVRPPDIYNLQMIQSCDEDIFYPDPILSSEESAWINSLEKDFITPLSAWKSKLSGKAIGLSIGNVSESELLEIGISNLHITDAERVIARYLLCSGANLVYGGVHELCESNNKNENLLTTLLETVESIKFMNSTDSTPLTNYVAWPYLTLYKKNWMAQLRPILKVNLLPIPQNSSSFDEMSIDEILNNLEGRVETAFSLSNMRELVVKNSDARIVLGGKTHNFTGFLPGILEESIYAIEHKQPLYILGGFGGTSALITMCLRKENPIEFSMDWQLKNTKGYNELLESAKKHPNYKPIDYGNLVNSLNNFGVESIRKINGLTEEENYQLWETNNLDVAIPLIIRGISNI